MSDFIVSARKYRPSTFDTVVGQLSITSTLKNSIKNSHLAQAYLFCGPRGVGKTTCARIFAKTINCLNLSPEIEACDTCVSCKGFNESSSYNILELDAASNNSVEDIRTIIDQVRIPPQIGKYSIYIIDEVHMLSTAAFNAFLKTLEEPPKHAIFILATTEKHKILPTILSRCQIFDFNRIKAEDAAEHLASVALKEGITAEPEALNVIALKADGAMRDALSIFDQVVSFCGKSITYKGTIENLNVLDYDYFFKLTGYFLVCDYRSTLLLFDEIIDKGFDGHNFLVGLSSHFRDLLVSQDADTLQLLEVGAAIRDKYKIQSKICSVDFLLAALDMGNKFELNYKASKNKRLHVELGLLQICSILKKKIEPELETDQSSAPAVQPVSVHAPVPKLAPVAASTPPPILSSPSFKDMMSGTAAADSVAVPAVAVTNIPPVAASPQTSAEDTYEEPTDEFVDDDQSVPEVNMPDLWIEFVNTLRNSHPRLYGILLAETPKIDRGMISYPLISHDQMAQATDIKSQAEEYLTRRSGATVQLHFTIALPSLPAANRPTKVEDKFAFLVAKNSKLDILKQKFDLNI